MKETPHTPDPNWHPIGPRRVENLRCEACVGKGSAVTEDIVPCDSCSGRGYVTDGENKNLLCRSCRGVKSLLVRQNRVCTSCDGKGMLPVIRQAFAGDVDCPGCDGRGTYEEPSGNDPEPCENCEGKGFTNEGVEYFAQEDWMASSERPTDLEAMTFSSNGEVLEWRASTGEFISITDCLDCEDRQGFDCPDCRGTRRVVCVAQPCDVCGGRCEVSAPYYIACVSCGGRGTIRVTESRVV